MLVEKETPKLIKKTPRATLEKIEIKYMDDESPDVSWLETTAEEHYGKDGSNWSHNNRTSETKKYPVNVKDKKGVILKQIQRVLRAECIGNFNPVFCTFLGKRYLVKSEEGDLSDPFRREESYANSFYITVEE